MSFTCKLESLIGRIALMIVVLVSCAGLVWVIYYHFIIRYVADPRLALNREAVSSASLRVPSSPRVLYRLALTEMVNGVSEEQFTASALEHAEKAVNLSVWDYKSRRLLGRVQELNGDQEMAEKSLRAAAQLAPSNIEVNWELANLLLRRGKLNEAVDPFRKAAGSNDELLSQAFDLLWQSTGGNLEILKKMAGSNASAQLSLVQFFLNQSLVAEALSIYRSMDREVKLNSPKSAAFIRSLMDAGQLETARSLWLDLLSSSVDPKQQGGSLVWNGSFESNSVNNFGHFDWTISPSQYARIGIDAKAGRSGSRSLKVAFAGRDTTTLKEEIKQMVLLRPGVRYHLECYAKAADLITPEGPRVAILGQNGVIASSEPVAAGSTDWQLLKIDFVAPEDSTPKFISVVRIPKFSYDDPTRGVVWFDDFSLSEILPLNNTN